MKRLLTLKDQILLSFLKTDHSDIFTDLEEIEPGKEKVNNIINYSKALSVIKTKTINNVHLILN